MRSIIIYALFFLSSIYANGQNLLFSKSNEFLLNQQRKIASKSNIDKKDLLQFFKINQTFLDRNELLWIDSSRNLLEFKNPTDLVKLSYQLHQAIIFKNKARNKIAKIKFEQLAEKLEKIGAKTISILARIENADFHRSIGLMDYAIHEINKVDTNFLNKTCYFLRAKYLHRIAAITFESEKNPPLGFQYSLSGLDLAQKHKDFCSMGINAMEIGYWYKHYKLNDELSEKYLLEAVDYFKKSNAPAQKMNAQFNLVLLYIHNHYHYEKGLPLALLIAEEYKKKPAFTFEIYRVYHVLMSQTEISKNYRKALKYSYLYQKETFEHLKRSNSAQIKEVQEEFKNQKLNLENGILAKEFSHSQSQLTTSESRNLWLASSLIFFLLLLITLILFILRIRRINRILYRQDHLNKRAIAMVSHDFKGTIYSLYPIVKELSSQPETEAVGARLNERIGVMREVSESLLSWLKSSLMSKEKYSKTKIKSNLNYLLGELNTRTKEKHLEIIVETEDEEATIDLDSDTLNLALRNLISNAIKYSWDGSTIIITYDQNYLKVHDFGIGLDSQKIKCIFDPKLNNSVLGTAGEKGYGMGLILTYDLLKDKGFSIKVESSVEDGTMFIISK